MTQGCGSIECKNQFCQSSGLVDRSLTPNQAAVRAIQLYVEDAKLCPNVSECNKVIDTKPQGPSCSNTEDIDMKEVSNDTSLKAVNNPSRPSEQQYNDNPKPTSPVPQFLDEATLDEMIESCEETKNYVPIIRAIGKVFSEKECVTKSFQQQAKSSIDVILDRVKQPTAITTMNKEEIRTLEDDEKELDSMDDGEEKEKEPSYTPVDLPSLRRSLKKLYEKNPQVFEAFDNAIQSLATIIQVDSRSNLRDKEQFEEVLCCLVILYEIFQTGSNLLEQSIIRTLAATAALPIWVQARLARIWSVHNKDGLKTILFFLQNIITLQVIANTYHREFHVHDNEIIANATKVMKILFAANLLASESIEHPRYVEKPQDVPQDMEEDDEDFSSIQYLTDTKNVKNYEDPLMNEIGISLNDYCEPFIPFEEFQNEVLCDAIEADEDFMRYKTLMSNDKSFTANSLKTFSFIVHSFILTPSAKTLAMFFDSRVKMYTERRTTLLNMHFLGGSAMQHPYLKLKIRRDFLIDDALAELEMVAMSNPKDLKKQLFIEFDQEQGIDEGGVSKEFFQLIVEEIFNPDYGMFITNEETRTCWFNSFSFENEAQFTLIGIVLGLAIYNSVILPLNFPMVVYKKLMNVTCTWRDLQDWNPALYNSLKTMIDYQEPDFEEVFSQTFEIGYENVFSAALKHELKKDGAKIAVNQHNKQEFVELYADFIHNKSIEKQFKAFKKGFQMVTDESPLQLLFRPEEIELIVCGSKKFDFDELEKSTEYEGGYTAESEIIKHFWSIVHKLPMESKLKLLQFTTGELKEILF